MNNMINLDLLNEIKKWDEKVVLPYIFKNNLSDYISRPFCFSVTKEYEESEKKVLIVGQEQRGWCPYSASWSLDDIQKWVTKYYEKQLSINDNDEKYNNSPFWKIYRTIKNGTECYPSWNNIDKMHQIKDGETKPLSIQMEKAFDATLPGDKNTLFEKEVEISKPDIIVFITGPHYEDTMEWSMNLEERSLNAFRPNITCPIQDISHVSKTSKKVFWTYHPNYLVRSKLFDYCTDRIINEINRL